MNSEQKDQPIPLNCGHIPFTKNTGEIRTWLEQEGYSPLRFYQGGEYIYPIITTWANAKMSWEEKDYSTFSKNSEVIKMPFLVSECCDESQFKKLVQELHKIL